MGESPWAQALRQIAEAYVSGEIREKTAVARMRALNFTPAKAQEYLKSYKKGSP